MEVSFTETVELEREYIWNVEPSELYEYFGDKIPNKTELAKYILNKTPDDSFENECTMESEFMTNDLDNLLDEFKEYLENIEEEEE